MASTALGPWLIAGLTVAAVVVLLPLMNRLARVEAAPNPDAAPAAETALARQTPSAAEPAPLLPDRPADAATATVSGTSTPTPEALPLVSPSVRDKLQALRATAGVQGWALWGREGALVAAQMPDLEALLPESGRLLRAAAAASSQMGLGDVSTLVLEARAGTLLAACLDDDLNLVVAADPAANIGQVRWAMYQVRHAMTSDLR